MTTIKNKFCDSIHRTGSATSPMRQIVCVQGSGKRGQRHEQVLSTPIEKYKGPEQFRHGPAHKPVEQYVFKVGARFFERFADATAVVLKRHRVELAQGDHQEYVMRALAINAGTEKLREIDLPEGFVPAAEKVAEAA